MTTQAVHYSSTGDRTACGHTITDHRHTDDEAAVACRNCLAVLRAQTPRKARPKKRTAVKARRDTPRRRDAPRGDAAWWEEATRLLLARCGSRCERCGHPLTALERHHRQRRAVGGDRLSNLLALHPACHAYITEHPTEAVRQGWIVEAAVIDPATVAVRLPGLTGAAWWLLDDHGGKHVMP